MFKKYGGAKRVQDMSGMNQILLDLKPKRSVSDVFINQEMDLTELVKYVESKKSHGENITYFHAFLAAIGKTIYNRPRLNYFVANRHLYEHDQIVISFVAKISFDDKSEEMMVMIPIEEKDDVYSISKKVTCKLDDFRKESKNQIKKAGANSAIDTLGKMPNFIRVPIIGLFKWTDKKGWLPSSLVEDNLYYSSVIVSNLGSIDCGAIFHNLADFGNASSLITMGKIEEAEKTIDGKKTKRKICDWGMNFDERIADGYYFVKTAKVLQYILDNPSLLEEPAGTKIDSPELR